MSEEGVALGEIGSLTQLVLVDLPASGALTRRWLDWDPTGPNLLADLRNTDYSAV